MSASTLPTLLLAISMPATQVGLLTRADHCLARQPTPRVAGRSATELHHSWTASQVFAGELAITGAPSVRADRFSGAITTIGEYLGLDEGWDGAYGIPASATAAEAAILFLSGLPHGIPEPTTMISPDGEVGLYWSSGSYYAEAGFDGDGPSYFFSKGAGRERVFLDGPQLPPDRVHEELQAALGIEEYPLAA